MTNLLLVLLVLLAGSAILAITVAGLWRLFLRWDKGMVQAWVETAWRSLFPARRLGWPALQRRILTRMRRRVTISVGGTSVVPCSFRVGLSPEDLSKMEGVVSFVEDDLGRRMASEARRHGWLCDGPPGVSVSVDRDAPSGFPQVEASFANVESPAPLGDDRIFRSKTDPLPRSVTRADTAAAAAVRTEPWVATELVSLDGGEPDIDLSGRLGPLLIGRGGNCDVSLGAPTVSETHALLRSTPAGWEVEDLTSRNGTYRNGTRLTRVVPLVHGDYVSFSQSGARFRYSRLDPSLPARTPSVRV